MLKLQIMMLKQFYVNQFSLLQVFHDYICYIVL